MEFLLELNERLLSAVEAVEGATGQDKDDIKPNEIEDENEDLPGPGAYEVQMQAVSKRIVGGKFGSGKRFDERVHKVAAASGSVGPGDYDPNKTFIGRRQPDVRISKPAKKALIASKEKKEHESQIGPGKYSPDYFVTSETVSARAPRIVPPSKPGLPLVMKQLEDALERTVPDPASYNPSYSYVKKKPPATPQWQKPSAPAPSGDGTDDPSPGPGAYDAKYDFVRQRVVSDVRITQEFSSTSVGRFSQASTLYRDETIPGPGSYNVDDALIHPRPPSTRIAPVTKPALQGGDDEIEGDVLLLDPNFKAIRPSVSCSVVMREESFVSQASTQRASDEQVLALDPDVSFLSTTRRSRSFSMARQTGREDGDHSTSPVASLGPGKYRVNYALTERSIPVTSVLRSSLPRTNPWFPSEDDPELSVGNRLLLDVSKGNEYLRKQKGVPDMARQTDRPDHMKPPSDFTGKGDYEVDISVLKGHVPAVDMANTTARASLWGEGIENDDIGPGAYDVDDARVRVRAPSVFMGTEETHRGEWDRKEDIEEGDVLDLDPEAADAARRAEVHGVIPLDKQIGRVERKPERKPEALDYSPDDLALRAHIRGFTMDGQVGRDLEEEGEEDKLFGKYTPDYSLCERGVTGVVEFDKMVGRFEDNEEEERREGDVLILHKEKAEEYLRVQKAVPDMARQTDRPDHMKPLCDFTGKGDYEVDISVLKGHVPVVDMTNTAARTSLWVAGMENDYIGPGAYDLDDTLVRVRAPSVFMGTEQTHREEWDRKEDIEEGDVLDLDPEAADAARRAEVHGVIPLDKQIGRVERKPERKPEALDYSPDDLALRAHIRGFTMDGQVGRDLDEEGEEDKLFGKYTPDYSLCERGVTGVVEFGKMVGRFEDNEEEERREGDVLTLHKEKAEEYLRVQKAVPDMARQTDRPDHMKPVSDFTGDNDYDVDISVLKGHVPAVDMTKVTGRSDLWSEGMENDNVGPGAYDVDDTLVRVRAPSVFMGTEQTHRGEWDRKEDIEEGDVLDLDPEAADAARRAEVHGVIPLDKQIGRVERKPERKPEALDYSPDDLALRAHIRGFTMDGQVGRDLEEEGEEDKLFGKYTPDYSLCERGVTGVVEFDKMVGRFEDNEEEERREGDVLILHKEKAEEYLKIQKAVPDLSKQVPRPQILPGQHSSDFTGTEDYFPNLSAVDPHVPAFDFGKLTGRQDSETSGSEGEDNELPGPGAYNPQYDVRHPRAPSAVIHPLSEAGMERGEDQDREGDVLILHPEDADSLIRPVAPRTIIQEPALETEWAQRRRVVGDDAKELPSIKERVEASRLEKEECEWSRTDFYDVDDSLVRSGTYTDTAVDMKKQSGRSQKPSLGITLSPQSHTSGRGASLPIIQTILKGSLAHNSGGLMIDDEVVMITRSDGTHVDLRRWARETGGVRRGACPQDVSRVVSKLGDWRECESGQGKGTFFYNRLSGKKVWRFPAWGNAEAVCEFVVKEMETAGFPMKLHVRRRPQLTALIAVTIRDVHDVAFASYQPKFDLVEAAPKGVNDFTRLGGREASQESKLRLKLFQQNLKHEMIRNTPKEMIMEPSEEDLKEEELLEAEMRTKFDTELHKLRQSQERERGEERIRISEIVVELGGEEGEGRGVKERLEKQVEERLQREWEDVSQRQRAEFMRWQERRKEARVVKVDVKLIEKEVERIVHQQKMKMDP